MTLGSWVDVQAGPLQTGGAAAEDGPFNNGDNMGLERIITKHMVVTQG